MAQNNVHITMTAAEASVVQAWLASARSVGTFTQAVQQAGQAGQQAGQKMSSGIDQAVVGMGRAALGLVGIGSAIQGIYTFAALVRKEFEAVQQYQRSAADRQVAFERSAETLKKQLPQDADMTIEQIKQKVKERSTGIPLDVAMNTVLNAIGTAPTATVSESVENALMTMEYHAEQQDSVKLDKTVQALNKVRSVFGGTAKEQLGFISSAQSVSLTADIDKFSDNIVTGLQALQKLGFTQKEATERMLAFQARAGDIEGATSMTNITLASRHAQVLLARQGITSLKGEEMFDYIQRKGKYAGTDTEQAAAIRREAQGVFSGEIIRAAELEGQPYTDAEKKAMRKEGWKFKGNVPTRGRTAVASYEMFQLAELATDPQHLLNVMKDIAPKIAYGEEAARKVNAEMASRALQSPALSGELRDVKIREQALQLESGAAIKSQRRKFLQEDWAGTYGGYAISGTVQDWLAKWTTTGTASEERKRYQDDIEDLIQELIPASEKEAMSVDDAMRRRGETNIARLRRVTQRMRLPRTTRKRIDLLMKRHEELDQDNASNEAAIDRTESLDVLEDLKTRGRELSQPETAEFRRQRDELVAAVVSEAAIKEVRDAVFGLADAIMGGELKVRVTANDDKEEQMPQPAQPAAIQRGRGGGQ